MSEGKFFTTLKNYWFIVIFLGTIIIGWVNFQNADVEAARRLQKVENDYQSLSIAQTQILVQLSQIQSDLKWLINNRK